MSVFREIYSQTSRFVYHENEILIDMHCPKSFVGIGKNAWRNKNNFLLWTVKNMIGRIFFQYLSKYFQYCWWWLQELILGKNDQSSTENEINITWWCVNIACPLHVPVQKKPKTNPRMIFWITKKNTELIHDFE